MKHFLFSCFVLAIFSSFGYASHKISLAFPWYDQFQFAGYYMAKKNGYYAQEGLDVSFVPFNPKTDLTKAIENEEIDYAVGRASLVAKWADGAKIVAINAYFQSSPLVFLTKKRDDIKNLKDFVGKKVMLSRVNIYDSLHAFLHASGVGLEDIDIQPYSYNINDLIEDKVDVMSAYISNEPFMLKERGIEYQIFNPKDYGFEFYSDILYTSVQKARTKKKEIKAFQDATLRGWKYAFSNLEETIDFIYKNYNKNKKTRKALRYEANILKELSGFSKGELGLVTLEKIVRIYDVFNLMGLITFDPNSQKEVEIESFLFKEGYLQKLALEPKEEEYLKSLKEIIVHNDMYWPPYNYNVNGVPKGFSIEYMNLLAKKLGISVRYLSGYTWAEFMELLPSSKLHAMINIVKTKNRAKSIAFSKPYATARSVIYVHKNNQKIESLKDLEGKKVATIKGAFASEYLKENYPKIKQIYVNNRVESLLKLSLEQVDAVIAKKSVADYFIAKNGLSDIVVAEYVKDRGLDIILRIGVDKRDKLLVQILDKAQDLVTEKEKRTLMQKWFGTHSKKQIKEKFELSVSQKEYLKNKKFISVCVLPDLFPYEGNEEGNFLGLSADFLMPLQKEVEVPFKIIQMKSKAELLNLLNEGACTIKPWMKVDGRDEENPYLPTEPYIEDSFSLVTKVKEPFISSLRGLDGKSIVLLKDFKQLIKYAQRRFPKINFVYANDIEEALHMVDKGYVFGYFGPSMISSYYIQKSFSKDLKIAKDIDTFSFGFGVREGEEELLQIFNQYLKSMQPIQKQKILHKWTTVIAEQAHDYTMSFKIFLGSFFIFIVGVIFLLRQNQLKNKIAEQKRAFERLFEKSYDGIVLFDEKDTFIDCNEAFLKMFGFTDKRSAKEIDLTNLSPMFQLNGVSSFEKVNFIKEMVKKDGFYKFEWLHNDVKGKEFWCEVIITAIALDQRAVFHTTVRNIQDRKETQLKLVKLNNFLEERIQEELEESRKKDQHILHQSRLAQMGEMISMIAHQWRQPLAAISATSSNLTFKLMLEEETEKDYLLEELELISEYSQHLSSTIDDFRNFFKANKQKQKSTLESIIEDTLKIVRPSFENKKISVSVDFKCHVRLHTYAQEIKQVLLNLLKNSEDAFLENKIQKPSIHIKTFKVENRNILSIKDNAGGIPEIDIERIFDPYFSTKKTKDGTGLGLYMSKIIIEEHCKGTLYVKNRSKGAEFFLEFISESENDSKR